LYPTPQTVTIGEASPSFEELPEQVELLRRELDLLVADVNLASPGVHVEVAVGDLCRFRVAPRGRRASQDRLHPGDELAGVERLRQVVVGPHLEPDDLVNVLVAGGQHQDRNVPALADPPANLDAVHVRKHQVEHDQSRLLGLDLRERISAGSDGLDAVARLLQVQRDERSDRGLVLDDEHGLGL